MGYKRVVLDHDSDIIFNINLDKMISSKDTPIIVEAKKFNSNNELRAHYNNHGWVSLKKFIPKKIISILESDFDKIAFNICGLKFEKAVIYLNKKNKDKLHQLCKDVQNTSSHMYLIKTFNEKYKKIFNKHQPIINLGQFVLPGPPADKRLIYSFHQESNYYKEYNTTAHFHFPIFNNTNLENGSMSVLSKTHKLKRIKEIKNYKIRGGFLSVVPKNLNQLIDKYSHITFDLKLGDLLLFDGNLVHKSNLNKTKKCRVVGIHRIAQI